MNKFINTPDDLASLAGCGFWLFALSIAAAGVFTTLAGLGGLAR